MTHRVGRKGQVVIPKDLRVELGIQPGDEVNFWLHEDHVAVRPVQHRRPLRGRLFGSPLTDELARERADDQARRDEPLTVVLDSWVVLRYLEDTKPVAEAVSDLLQNERPLMSWINLGEVHYVVRRLHGENTAAETVRDLSDVVDAWLPDERSIIDAARIKADHPMAYADAFAAALTVACDATLWTGDPELLIDGSAWRWRDLRR